MSRGSFEAAARTLHVTPSAVSQRIKALEHQVGQVLVRRAKPCRATEAGQPLLRLAGQVALLEDEALQAMRGPLGGGRSSTRVAVVVNADSLATWFLAAVAALPPDLAVTVDLREDDEGHTAGTAPRRDGDCGGDGRERRRQWCRVQRLGAMRYLPDVTDIAERHFLPARPDASALAVVPMLVFDRKDRLQHRFVRAVTRRRVDPPIHYVPSVPAFSEAIRLGLGWGLVPEQLARDDLAAGRLVDVGAGRHVDVPLHWQHWRLESTVLEALTASVRTVAAAVLR